MKIKALYDENCRLCQEMKKRLQRLDVLEKVQWISLQEFEKSGQTHSFTAIDLRKELHIILPNGMVLKGFYAIRKLLILSPYTLLPGLFLYVPPIPVVGKPIYHWVAKNRHKFLKQNCDGDHCSF